MRKAGLVAAGLFLAAVLLAIGVGALLALLLADRVGVGFLRFWLSAAALLLGIPLAAQGVTLLAERRRGRKGR